VITPEENGAAISLNPEVPNVKDPRAEEDLGRRFPEGRVAEIYAIRGKTLWDIVKEAKLIFEIPKPEESKELRTANL
jgi:hypothetical protein